MITAGAFALLIGRAVVTGQLATLVPRYPPHALARAGLPSTGGGFARQVADRVIFMDRGRIVEEAAPADFFENPQNEHTKLFLSQILH